MAVIKNSKTGCWEVRCYYKDFTGKLKQKTKRGFKRRSDAVDWERAFKLKEDQNLNMEFKDFVEIYKTDMQSRVRYNTWLTKEHIINMLYCLKIEPLECVPGFFCYGGNFSSLT